MIPLWAIKLGIGLLAVVGIWGHGYTHGKRAVMTKWEAASAEALAKSQAEGSRRVMRLQENVDVAYLKQRQAESDARSLRDARDGLLNAATGAGAAACHSAATPGSAAASSPDVVPADLFRSIEERAELLAGAADGARIAGQLCQSAYDALTPPK